VTDPRNWVGSGGNHEAVAAQAVGSTSRDGKEYLAAQQAIDRAMTRALWRSNEIDVHNNMLDRIEGINADYGEIDLRLGGVARWYLERRDALRKQDTAAESGARGVALS
jgi:pectin methylesterase-like acyl-CoA thioesterase